MALGLKDLNSNKRRHKNEGGQLKRSLRPWESFSDSAGVRTISANDAVAKAQRIVEKNNVMVNTWKSGELMASVVSADTVDVVHTAKTVRCQQQSKPLANKPPGLIGLIKYILGSL